ncbi:prolipoprotein diacylglyceryl transferase, partial [Mycobacterium avium subsp. hominissuis]
GAEAAGADATAQRPEESAEPDVEKRESEETEAAEEAEESESEETEAEA